MTAILALKASILLILALVAARAAGRRNPSLAHLVLGLGLLAALLLPFADAALPIWRVPVLPPAPPARPAFPEPAGPPPNPTPVNRLPFVRPSVSVVVEPPAPVQPVAWLGFVWAFGVAAVALRSLVGAALLWSLRRRSVLCEPPALEGAGLRRPWELRRGVGAGPSGPLTWGLLRPIVLLPAESVRWSEDRLRAVLLHELAHVRRGDAAWGLLAEAACALHWFSPLVWIAARRMREMAELAADQAVLRGGVPAADYAAELLRLATELRRPTRLLPGAQAMNSPKIESRLRAVLANEACPLTFRQATLVIVAALAAVPALAALHPVALQSERGGPERAEALRRIKNLGGGTLMYAQDYDDRLPTGQSTKVAAWQVLPYARGYARSSRPPTSDAQLFQSPTPGGRFLFNTMLAGHFIQRIENPAETIAWFETLPGTKALGAVAYVEGHAALVNTGQALFRQMRVRPAHQPRRESNEATLAPVASAEQRLAQARARLIQAQVELVEAQATAEASRARRSARPLWDPQGYRLLQTLQRQIDVTMARRAEVYAQLARTRANEAQNREARRRLETIKAQMRTLQERARALRKG